jgi:hypothetical protein
MHNRHTAGLLGLVLPLHVGGSSQSHARTGNFESRPLILRYFVQVDQCGGSTISLYIVFNI